MVFGRYDATSYRLPTKEGIMPRAKRGNKRLHKRKGILKLARGYRGTKSKLYRHAKEQVERSLNFAFTGRKLKKRDFRRLWIARINALAREYGLSYSRLIDGVNKNLSTFHRYLGLRKRMMGVDELHYYDLYAPLVSSVQLTYTPEQSEKHILEAVAPLSVTPSDPSLRPASYMLQLTNDAGKCAVPCV